MEHIERINRELVHKGTILNICRDTIKTPDGNIAYWDFIDHKGAAAVVPVLPDGRIVLVRQYRNALDRETLEIPAGGLEKGEPTIKAAARELEEETGYKSENLSFLISVATAVAFCNEIVDIYLAKNLVKSCQNLDEDEYIDVVPLTIKQIEELIYSGKIQDSKTIAAVLAYKNKYCI